MVCVWSNQVNGCGQIIRTKNTLQQFISLSIPTIFNKLTQRFLSRKETVCNTQSHLNRQEKNSIPSNEQFHTNFFFLLERSVFFILFRKWSVEEQRKKSRPKCSYIHLQICSFVIESRRKRISWVAIVIAQHWIWHRRKKYRKRPINWLRRFRIKWIAFHQLMSRQVHWPVVICSSY